MSKLLGVKYIGAKDRKIDTIFNTGAVWSRGETINFEFSMAMALGKHTDSFEVVEFVEGAGLYMPNKQTQSPQESKEPIGYFDVEAMDASALDVFALRHFGRSINKDDDIKNIRAEVLSMARVDAIYDETMHAQSGKDLHFIATLADESEYQAYLHGIVELRLVPVEAKAFAPVQPVTPPVELTQEVEVITTVITAPVETQPVETKADALPTLPELLAKLDKKGLITLAKENGVKTSNTMTEEMLRTKLLKELAAGEG